MHLLVAQENLHQHHSLTSKERPIANEPNMQTCKYEKVHCKKQ